MKMNESAALVSRLIVQGLNNGLAMPDVEELVQHQFGDISRPTLWEGYNIALLALARGESAERLGRLPATGE